MQFHRYKKILIILYAQFYLTRHCETRALINDTTDLSIDKLLLFPSTYDPTKVEWNQSLNLNETTQSNFHHTIHHVSNPMRRKTLYDRLFDTEFEW